MDNLPEIGTLGIALLFLIKELFSYLKSRKDVPQSAQPSVNLFGQPVLNELQRMNDNHLSHIQAAIEDGNKDVTKAITDGHAQMIQVLGEIKGVLEARR